MFKFIALLASMVMTFSTLTSSVNVSENVTETIVPQNIQYEIDIRGYGEIESIRSLFDSEQNVVGYCYEFDNAYIIFDSDGKVMEHSPETNSPYYNINDTVYYAGPLMYFTESDNDIIELNSQEIVSIEEFEALYDNVTVEAQYERPVVNNGDVSIMSTSGFNMETYYIDGTLRTLDYNTQETCGPLAFAIVLLWYDDYIDDGFVQDFFSTYPEALHDMLVSRYFPERGTNYTTLVDGMDEYFDDYFVDASGHSVNSITSFDSYVYYTIGIRKKPAIVGLYDIKDDEYEGGWSINHWVIAYGLRDYYMDGQKYNREYIVNDGWGNNNVYITYSTNYMDGAVSVLY